MGNIPDTESGLKDNINEIALVWYKDLVVFILAVFSYIISNYCLFDLKILAVPTSTHPLLIGFLCILWFFGVNGIVFLGFICLFSLNTQLLFLMTDRLVLTGTSLNMMNYWGKITFSLPFSEIESVSCWNKYTEEMHHGYPLPDKDLIEDIIFKLKGGGYFTVITSFIIDSDRKKFFDLLPGS